jgi:uncharacterized membrane protein YbhN (UPF0104 family)
MRFDWRSALGLALSALLLWWTLHGEPLGEVWAAIVRSNWPLLLLATAVGTSIFPIRARKWRTILEPVAGRLPFGPLWRATAIGMMVNNVVPARAGELARAFALSREVPRVGFPASLASLAVDRVFDAIVLLALMFAALLDPAFPPGVRVWGQSVPMLARGGATMVGVLLVGLYAFIAAPHLFEGAFRWVARRVVPRIEEPGARAVRTFAEGLGALRHPGASRRCSGGRSCTGWYTRSRSGSGSSRSGSTSRSRPRSSCRGSWASRWRSRRRRASSACSRGRRRWGSRSTASTARSR